jgi:hypothetical protein
LLQGFWEISLSAKKREACTKAGPFQLLAILMLPSFERGCDA